MLAIWTLVPLPFLNPAWTSGSSRFTHSWSLAWRVLSVTLLACEMSLKGFEYYLTSMWNSCVVVWTFFGIALLWDWNENWPFPVLWPLLSFPNFLVYWFKISKGKLFTHNQKLFCVNQENLHLKSTLLALRTGENKVFSLLLGLALFHSLPWLWAHKGKYTQITPEKTMLW